MRDYECFVSLNYTSFQVSYYTLVLTDPTSYVLQGKLCKWATTVSLLVSILLSVVMGLRYALTFS